MVSLKDRPGILNRLGKTCYAERSLPTSMIVAFSSLRTNRTPEACGGFGDVYRGEYRGRPAAVKRLRFYTSENREAFLQVCIPLCTVHKEPALNLPPVGVLPGSRRVETSTTSKHSTIGCCDIGPARNEFCTGFEVDGQWQHQ